MEDGLIYTNIKFLSKVGDKRAALLQKEAGIVSYKDLLYYFPYRYIDRSQYVKISEINSDKVYIQIRGKVVDKQTVSNGKSKRLVVGFADDTGRIELIYFSGLKWIYDKLNIGQQYVVFGKPSMFNNGFNFVHPETELLSVYTSMHDTEFLPLYNTTEKMKNSFLSSRAMASLTLTLIRQMHGHISETLPEYIVNHYKLISLQQALENIHYPQNMQMLAKAQYRLKFEELFFMQLVHQMQKTYRKVKSDGFVMAKVGDKFNDFYNKNLPFPLTDAQKRVIKEIRSDMRSGRQMNRLLQGDVGSGKTLVALMCMLIAVDNGYQCALVAPTEILAKQHCNSLTEFLKGLNVQVALLTSEIKGKARKNLLSNLQEGAIDILVGTHAVLESAVQFANLGFAVIDEQHRFGVEQRRKMWEKSKGRLPHILVMTATPIPRTLAMTVYGDLDCSVIDQLPPGRKPVSTVHLTDASILKVYDFMRTQIAQGRQIYVVYPLIEESEKLDLKDLNDGYDHIVQQFPLPDYQISIVHGKMKSEQKEYEMERFVKGITNIMVSTTVIEVGVNVPNASVMVIQNAERFGLSQLHQLRGRVGRGSDKSYCILMTKDNLSQDSKRRIEIMCQTNDGFVLAQEDLALRGPGDIAGTQQSGVLDLKIADIVKDEPLVRTARDLAQFVLDKDPMLQDENNRLLKQYITAHKVITDYSEIS